MTIKEVCEKLYATLESKNAAYGNIIDRESPLVKVSRKEAVLIRIADKIARLESLATRNDVNEKESFDDTILDLAGYCVLYFYVSSSQQQ